MPFPLCFPFYSSMLALIYVFQSENSCRIKLTVIGCGTKGGPKTVCLSTDHKLYLFNCGDGTNKLFMSTRMVNSCRLDHVFVTQVNWDNIGGIYGKSLSQKSQEFDLLGGTHTTIHGGKQIREVLSHSIMFAEERLFQSNIDYRDITDGTFQDEDVIVDYVPLTHEKLRKFKDKKKKKFVVKKCQLKKTEGASYGCVIMTVKSQKGFFVGKVETGLSANLTGVCQGDRIVEVNGQNVSQLTYSEVIELIKKRENRLELLVVDNKCDRYCMENEITISSTMDETDLLMVEERDETFAEEEAVPEITQETRPVMGYLVKLQQDRNKVNKDVLKKLGIKPGPFVKQILEGKSVEVNGTLLTPEILLESPEVLRPMLVLDCPSEDYLESLLESKEISSIISDPNTVPQIIVHFTPARVVEHPKYKEFMQRFKADLTNHLMLNKSCPQILQNDIHSRQVVLNTIHDEMFPLLHCDQDQISKQEGNVIKGVYGLEYFFKPKHAAGFSWHHVSNPSIEEMLKEHYKDIVYSDEAKQLVSDTQIKCKQLENSLGETKEYPVFNFLGTGSSMPSRYRAQSCIVVETCKDEFIILDCGESALMHLYLMFGEKRAEEILCNLKGVFLSHLHYDHIGGIMALGLKRHEVLAKEGRYDKLTMVAPAKMKKWMAVLNSYVFNTNELFNFIPMANIQAGTEYKFTTSTARHLQLEMNMKQFTAIPVDHVLGSFGVYLEHNDGWTMLYSGDTRPCPLLVKYGYGKTDYLIHEGTFSTSEKKMAYEKKHSTIGQAISIANQMKAKQTILTHFSQRYPTNPPFEDLDDKVAFAYDFMQLKPKHIPMVPYLKQAMAVVFQAQSSNPNQQYTDRIMYNLIEKSLAEKRKKAYSDNESELPNSKEQKLEDGIV